MTIEDIADRPGISPDSFSGLARRHRSAGPVEACRHASLQSRGPATAARAAVSRLWAGKIAVACGWPQEVRRFEVPMQLPETS